MSKERPFRGSLIDFKAPLVLGKRQFINKSGNLGPEPYPRSKSPPEAPGQGAFSAETSIGEFPVNLVGANSLRSTVERRPDITDLFVNRHLATLDSPFLHQRGPKSHIYALALG